jgi:hypothetical protein
LAFLCLLALPLFLGQPVALTGVDCLICIPLAPTNVVGMMSFEVQRFPFAASAESGPCGRCSSNVPIGTSGIVRNVLLVIPALLMNVSPCR